MTKSNDGSSLQDDSNVAEIEAFPVSVILQRKQVQRGQWSWPQWDLVAVVTGENIEHRRSSRMKIHSDADAERYLWAGLELRLYKDGAESYWYNLMAKTPSLFVVCQDDPELDRDGELAPFIVTANQDEALAHMETDDLVLAVPMPEVIHQWVERFVVKNYVPQQKKKRKRRDWADEVAYAQRSQARRS